jgi:hemerythrin-like metal-binding protein
MIDSSAKKYMVLANISGGLGLSAMIIVHSPVALLLGAILLFIAIFLVHSENYQQATRKSAPSSANLATLVWRESLSSGNGLIDKQHRDIFDLSNRLLYAILQYKPKAEVQLLVQQLRVDIEKHFKTEEAILAKLNHPVMETHVEEHREVLKKADELIALYNHDALDVGRLYKFVSQDLITMHIAKEDVVFRIAEHITLADCAEESGSPAPLA